MLDYLTSSQLSEWEAYDRIDPLASWREDYNFASLKALICNMMGSKDGKTLTPLDMMPEWDRTKIVQQSDEDISRAFKTLAKDQIKRVDKEQTILKKINKPPVKRK